MAGRCRIFIVLGLFDSGVAGSRWAQIAYMEIGPVAGTAATVGILFVLIIALAGRGEGDREDVGEPCGRALPGGDAVCGPACGGDFGEGSVHECAGYRCRVDLFLRVLRRGHRSFPVEGRCRSIRFRSTELQPTDGREYSVSLDTYEEF